MVVKKKKKSFLKILNSYLIDFNLGCFFNKFIKLSKKDHKKKKFLFSNN